MPQSDVTSSTTARSAARSKGAARTRKPEAELETRELLAALRAFRRGDFSVRLPKGLTGVGGEIAEAFNDVVELEDGADSEKQ